MRRSILFFLLLALVSCGCNDDSDSSAPKDPTQPGTDQPGTDQPGDKDKDKPKPPADIDEYEFRDEIDSDNDTISDTQEGRNYDDDSQSINTDGDETPDYLDPDSDNDTIPDAVEAQTHGDPTNEPADSDGDGIYDYRDTDSDDNGIPDGQECNASGPVQKLADCVSSNPDGYPDFLTFDNDGDGIDDVVEFRGLRVDGHVGKKCGDDWCAPGSLENPYDADGDTIPDYLDPDSDNDTILDLYESTRDSNRDGIFDIYSADSDGDTLPDSLERGSEQTPADSNRDGVYDFQSLDSDGDGLPDPDEVVCDQDRRSYIWIDTDGDGQSDLAEYLIAKKNNQDPKSYICDASKTVKEFIDFYFELPTTGGEKSDVLTFNPSVTKADIFLNIDNTGSTNSLITAIQKNFASVVVQAVRERIPDSQFGLSVFRDRDASPIWSLRTAITDDDALFQERLDAVSVATASTDAPEAGYNALIEITKNGGFREGALPIVLHVTDATTNERTATSNNGATKAQTQKILQESGVRVIQLGAPIVSTDANILYETGRELARMSNAVVPVCAYQMNDGTWPCGIAMCCTHKTTERLGREQPEQGVCPLSIFLSTNFDLFAPGVQPKVNAFTYQTVLAIEALVKYSAYNVSTRVIGETIPEDERATPESDSTACFIQRIEALEFIAPDNETVSSCMQQIQTAPKDFANNGFNDGFENFAVGGAKPQDPKSGLTFKVVAQNNGCVKKSIKPRTYKATIQVIDPITQLVFDKQEVMILVPGEILDSIN